LTRASCKGRLSKGKPLYLVKNSKKTALILLRVRAVFLKSG
jgi:hypothetical protein